QYFITTSGVEISAAPLRARSLNSEATTVLWAEVHKAALADAALSTAKKLGASYADIRINRYRNQNVSTREREVLNVSSAQNFGFGVRVLINGTWGFAASPVMTIDEVVRITKEA